MRRVRLWIRVSTPLLMHSHLFPVWRTRSTVLSMPILLDTPGHIICKWTFQLSKSIIVQCSRIRVSRVVSSISVMVGDIWFGSIVASFSVFFARDDSVSDATAPVNTIPFPLLVTFSQPLSVNLASSHFTLVNCAISAIDTLNPTLARVKLVPLLRSDFSIFIPTGALTSTAGSTNTAAAAVFQMTSAVLTTHLQSILYNMIGVRVRYSYDAQVFCTRTTEDIAPASCAALRADAFARSRNITEGETIVPLMGFDLGATYYVWCCAEEPLDVQPTNSLQDTRLVATTGWLDCPLVDGNVCNGHGSCYQGQYCVCDDGFYGADCTSSCPGLLSVNATSFVECGGHGRCNAADFQCRCEDSFVTNTCQLPLLTQRRPETEATAYLYLYLELQNLTQSPFTFPQQQQRERVVTALTAFFNVSYQQMGVAAWMPRVHAIYVEFDATVAAQKLQETGTSQFSQRLEASLVGIEGISAVTVSHAFLMRSNQTDPFFCYDGMQNEDETDIDCGGSMCSRRCRRKERCSVDRDCEQDLCSEGLCITLADKYRGWIILIVCLLACIVLSVLFILCYCCAHVGGRRKRLPIVASPVVAAPEDMELRSVSSAPDRSTNRKRSIPDLAQANLPVRRTASPGRSMPSAPFPLPAIAREIPVAGARDIPVAARSYGMSTDTEDIVLESDLSAALESNLDLLPHPPAQTDSFSSSSNRDGIASLDIPSLSSSVDCTPLIHASVAKRDHLHAPPYARAHLEKRAHPVVANSARERVGYGEQRHPRVLHRVPVSEGGVPHEMVSLGVTSMGVNPGVTSMGVNPGMTSMGVNPGITSPGITSTGITPGHAPTGHATTGRQLHRVVVGLPEEDSHRPVVIRAPGMKHQDGIHVWTERRGVHEPMRSGLVYVNPNERESFPGEGSSEGVPLAVPTVSVKPVVPLTQLIINTE